MSLNEATIMGRIGKDPETKNLQSGQTVTTFSVATSETWLDKQGNKQEQTEWHNIVFWGKQGETIAQYMGKGSEIWLRGKLQTRSWEDQNGQKRYTTEIVGREFKFTGGSKRVEGNQSAQQGAPASQPDYGPEPSFDSNEDIPL